MELCETYYLTYVQAPAYSSLERSFHTRLSGFAWPERSVITG